jgi:hypothetical protein
LAEFEINEKVIDEAIAKTVYLLMRFKFEDKSLKKIQFNNKIADFIKCQNKHDISLLGTLTYKSINCEISNLRHLSFCNEIVKSYDSGINIYKQYDGNNYVFYLNTRRYFNLVSFDNNGKVIRQNLNALNYNGGGPRSELSHFEVAQTSYGFILYAKLNNCGHYSSTAICGQTVDADVIINNLLIKIDRNFTYLSHKVNLFGNNHLLHLAANNSNILCIDSSYKYNYLDMDLNVCSNKLLHSITNQVGNTFVDFQINDQFAFILCSDKKMKIFKMKIFELHSGGLVKEIITNANQFKLASTDYLILYDSINQQVDLCEQFGDFYKLDEVDLAQLLNTGFMMSRDKSAKFTF